MEAVKEIVVDGYRLAVGMDGSVHVQSKETVFVRNGREGRAVFKARPLRPYLSKGGYLQVDFVHEGKRKRYYLHRLLGQAFVPGFAEGLVINHIDGDKANNSIENLEWVTKGRNSEHAWEKSLVNLRGEEQPTSKLTRRQVSYIRKALSLGLPASTIAGMIGVSVRLICKIRDGKLWAGVPSAL